MGVGIRFIVNRQVYTGALAQLVVAVLLLWIIYAIFVTWYTFRAPWIKQSNEWITFLIVSDIILISMLNLLSFDAQSDLFLLYFLPLLVSVEYFNKDAMIRVTGVFAITAVVFGYVVFISPSRYSFADVVL